MKKIFCLSFFIVLSSLIPIMIFAQKTQIRENAEITALQNLTNNYLKLSSQVNQMTSNMSEIEKQRAAFFLISTYSLVIESYVERGNPASPAITEWMFPPRKFGGDNPYTIYSQVPVSPEYSYKLYGKKGDAIYFGVQVYGYQEGFNLPTANLGIDNIKYNSDGTFDIYISKIKPDGAENWIPLADKDHAFLVRQYFANPQNIEPYKLNIVRIDDNHNTGSSYLDRLKHANNMLTDYIMGTIDIASILEKDATNHYPAANAEITKPKYGGALYPTKDNKYQGCWVKLNKGEALRVHGYLPKNTLYASYVFYDRWYNTPSYPKIDCFRTKDNVVLNPDGSFDLYVTPEEINHPNWINTGGLYEGSYSTRYLISDETVFPTVEVVKIKDIK